jgi:elongation factor P
MQVAAILYSQVRKGMILRADGQFQLVVGCDLNTFSSGRPPLQLKLKDLASGAISLRRVYPDDQAEQAFLAKREMQYIYQDGDGYVFMDNNTCDQYTLEPEWVAEQMLYTKEGQQAEVVFYEGRPLGLELPATVELTVTATEPAVTAPHKRAILETGLKVVVPPFIKVGEAVAVDTRTGAYLGRGSK